MRRLQDDSTSHASTRFTAMTFQLHLRSALLGLGILLTHLPASQAEETAATTIQIQQEGNTRTASMTVPVSPSHAWTVLTNYVATGEAMPDISKVQLLSRNGNVIRMRQTYQAPYTFGLTISATLSVKETPKTSIRFQMVEGELIRQLNGSWTITPTSMGTRLRHTITLVPELPPMLQSIFAELTRTSLHESMQHLSDLMQAND